MTLEPPDYIDDRAKQEFVKLAGQLASSLRETDVYVLADFCQALSDIIDLMAIIKVEGKTILNMESGATKMNPNVSLLLARRQAFSALRKDLGLTPASRKEKPPKGNKSSLKESVKSGEGDLL